MSSSRKWVKEQWNYEKAVEEVVEDYDITIEYEIEGDQNSYDWSTATLLTRKKDGRVEYAAYLDSGCSCNFPYEMPPSWYSFSWMPDASEAVRRIKEYMKENKYHFSEVQRAEESIKLRQWVRVNG